MAKSYPIQSSFAAGEVSPNLYGRFDTPGYQQGLLECTNAIVDSRGPVKRRPGFEHIAVLGALDTKLFTFDYSRDEPFLVAFTDLLVKVSSSTLGGLGAELISNGNFDVDGVLAPWTDESAGSGTVEVVGGSCLLTPTKGDPVNDSAMISQQIFIATLDTYRVQLTGVFGPVGDEWELRIGTAAGLGDISTSVIPGGATFYTEDIAALAVGTPFVSVYAPGWNVGGNPNTEGNVGGFSFRQVIPAQPTVQIVTPYLETEVEALRGQMSPDGLYMVITHANHPPQILTYDPTGPLWTFAPWTFTSAPVEWAGVNFPITMCFFDGRSWWAGCVDNPETIWASKPGAYDDLTVGVNPDDALKFIIAEHGRVLWIESSKNLLVGTALREFFITSEAGVIGPGDIQIEQQSAYGSAPIQPRQIGNETMFVAAISTKVRTLWYQWTDSGYLSREISYTNNHIVGSGVRHMSYQRDPSEFMWFAMKNGNLVGCTYHKDGNDKPVFGWHKHAFPGGVIVDSTVLYQGDEVLLVVAVRINVNGVNEIHLMGVEIQPDGQLTSGIDVFSHSINGAAVYLDDYISVELTPGQLIVPGLDHLEGLTVTPVVDDAVQTDKVVVGGEITLDTTGGLCHVGLTYVSTVKTLPQVQPAQAGSTATFAKHRNKIYARMVDSALPKINGQRTAERHPSTPMNEGEPLFTGDTFVTNSGWDALASITFEQDLPYPMNIVAVFGEMAQETL